MGINHITIGGVQYSIEELGLQRITVDNKTYLDVTPFWIDCKSKQRIESIIRGPLPTAEEFERKEDKL